MDDFSGPQAINSTCKKMLHRGMMVRGLTVLNVRIEDLVEKCLYDVLYVIINSLSVQQYNDHNFHAL